MLKFKLRNLISVAVFFAALLLLASSVPSLRPPLLNILKSPLQLLTLLRDEASGLIFYHCNYVQNKILNKQVDYLRNKLNEKQEIYQENSRLKELLSFKKNSPLKLIASRVISRQPENWSSIIIIDKGSRQGIRHGMVAINYLGLVGRVIETTDATAKVMLINDPNLGVSAVIQRSRQEGLVSGTLGSNLIMRYLPEDADIKVRDLVITSGLNQQYPKGLVIGEVLDIGKEFSGLTSYAIIKPAVNLSDLEEVLVVVP